MTGQRRTFTIAVLIVLLVGLVAPFLSAGPLVHAQDDTAPGTRPAQFPAELAIGGRYFLYDRQIPLPPEGLVEAGRQGELVVFAETADGAPDRLFVSPSEGENLARYLPQRPLAPDGTALAENACLAQPPQFGDLETGDGLYAYAGPERDVPLDNLIAIATTVDNFTVYAEPNQQPASDLLVDTGTDLVRFVLLDEAGRPPMLEETLQFQGVPFLAEGDAAGAVDAATLAQVGCAGPFPLSAPVDQVESGVVDQVYVAVGARLLAYRAVDNMQVLLDQIVSAAQASPATPDGTGEALPVEPAPGTPTAGSGEVAAEATAEAEAPPIAQDTTTCAAETANFAMLTVGEDRYVYAGPETAIPVEQLQQVFQTVDGEPVYAETAEAPYGSLFFVTDGTLNRFVLLDARGVPSTLGETIDFAGQSFVFARDATGEVNPDQLLRAGCVGPFSARVAQGETEGAIDEVFIILNDATPRVLAFTAAGPGDAATPPATEEPVLPTVAPQPTATATPAPVATPAPTATPVPPTETPIPPTETLLPPTATALPPTATIPPPTATEAPATPPPAATPPVIASPPSDAVPTPLTLATVPPPATPVSDIPVDAPPPIPETLPREIEVQGIRYAFDLQVDVDLQALTPIDVVQAEDATLNIYASPDDQLASAAAFMYQAPQGPFGRVYAVSVATGVIARYVSEVTVTSAGAFDVAAACPAEGNARSFSITLANQRYVYTFASVETTLAVEELRTATVAALGEVPLSDDGREILVRAGTYPGLAEVFLVTGDGLERYVALNAAGFPVTLNDLVFAETRFRYEAQVSVSVTETGFRRIGCSGGFPLYAPAPQAEAAAPLATSFTVIENRVYQFVAVEIVVAPAGQTPPPAIVPPPPGYVQITLQTTVIIGPTPTPLPNVRLVPLPGATATQTPASGLVAEPRVRQRRCLGDPGAIGADGLPERLPRRVQFSGVAYRFAGQEQIANDVRLPRIGCVGPFEAVQGDGTGGVRVVFLRTDRMAQTLYRYEAGSSFAVDFTVAGDPRVITSGDGRYLLGETWRRSLYSGVTVIVYAADPDAVDPPRVYTVKVDGDVIAEYVPEGGDVVEAPAELRARAEALGVNPDLVLGGGRRYLLVNLWTPVGTTTNGWVSLYAATGEAPPETLLATDPRSLDLFVYRRSG